MNPRTEAAITRIRAVSDRLLPEEIEGLAVMAEGLAARSHELGGHREEAAKSFLGKIEELNKTMWGRE